MKLFVVMMSAVVFIGTALTTSTAQRASEQMLGLPRPQYVRSIESVREVEPAETDVQIVVVTDNGRMTLVMGNSTAHALAVAIRVMEAEPLGAP